MGNGPETNIIRDLMREEELDEVIAEAVGAEETAEEIEFEKTYGKLTE